MSVRFDAATDRVSFAGAVPDPSAGLTLLGWAYVSVDRDDFSTMARLHASSGASTTATFATGSEGLGGPGYFTAGGSVTNATGFVVGEWRKVAISCTGTTGRCYVATDGGPTEVDSGTVGGAASPTGITLGGRSPVDGTEWFNGRLAYWRLYSAELSQAEIEAEWASATPVRTADLWADWPLEVHTDLTDHSGNGRHLTVGSTSTTTEDGPPVGPGDIALAMNPATEVDTAVPFGAAKSRVFGAAGAVEQAQPLGRHKTLAAGTAVDSTAAQPVGRKKTRALGAAVETDTAIPFVEDEPMVAGGVDMQVRAIMAKVTSVVQSTGLFETVNGGELTHQPGRGLRAAVWADRIESPPGMSGLSDASVRMDLVVRIYGTVHRYPVDEIDPDMVAAADTLCDAYVNGFTLGDLVRSIDLHGMYGRPMSVQAGYLDIQDGTCRVLTLTLPLIINDAWSEVA